MSNSIALFIVFFLLTMIIPGKSLCQENTSPEDSIFIEGGSLLFIDGVIQYVPNDTMIYNQNEENLKVGKDPYQKSDAFYDSLEEKMGRSWFTKELYNILFKPKTKNNMADTIENYRSERFFTRHKGLKINDIYLKKVDVLEGSVDDTLLFATSGFGKLINNIHINTQDWVLSKFLLFEKGDHVDPYVLADNERVIRNLSFIEDARIRLDQISGEEVDVYIITQDIFSLGIDGGIRKDEFSAQLFDKNIMGTGGEISFGLVYQHTDSVKRWGKSLGLEYVNFWGSFIDGRFQYINTLDHELVDFRLKKEFLTPQIKYAGELSLGWKKDIRYDQELDTLYIKPYQVRYSDLWLGRSFILNRGLERTNLILALRTGQRNYLERPAVRQDSNAFFHDRKFLLSSIVIKKINYLKSSKILRFGQIEDIPYGYMAKLLVGYSSDEFYDRPYFGMEFTAGKYLDRVGYLGVSNRLGTFWHNEELEEMLLTINMVYYTPLLHVGRYQTRSIIQWNNNFGINHTDERGVNFSDHIRGFENGGISGLGSFVFSMENILFTPWYYYGFRFAPFVFADIGILSNKGFELQDTETYSSLGLGFRIRNESLTISTLEIRLAYIPNLTQGGTHFDINFSTKRPVLFSDIFEDRPTFNTVNVH